MPLLAGTVLLSICVHARAEDRAANPPAESDTSPRPGPGAQPVPLRSYIDQEGRSCRVYERRVVIDGGPAVALATVCRDATGRWVLSR